MNVKRSIAIALVAGAAAVWFAWAMTPAVLPHAVPSAPPAIDRSGAALQQEIDRLHERLRPDASPRTAVRNPFAFRRGARQLAAPSAAPVADPPASSPPPMQSPIALAGLAEDTGTSGTIRTAIISASGQVFLVHEGESLTVGGVTYVVASVAAGGVELRSAADGTIKRLSLK